MAGKKKALALANAAVRSLPNASERARNRASPRPVVNLYPDLNEGQKGAIVDMDLSTMLGIKCKSLHNPVINWLAPLYDKFSREFVIPGRGRIPLNPDSVHHTLGLPHGDLPVPYSTDSDIESRLDPIIFPNYTSTPKITEVYKELKEMTDSGENFKQMWIMYLVCTLLAPTTCNKVSNRCYPIMDKFADVPRMGFCKFVCDKLHEELSIGKFSSACLFHLQLLYVDSLDVSGLGLELPETQFVVNKWSKEDIDKVLIADLKRDGSGYGNLELKPHLAINLRWFGGAVGFEQWIETNTSANCSKHRQRKVSKLIGNFAFGMTGLLSSLVQGWTEMDDTDDAEMEKEFGNACHDFGVDGPSDNVRVKKKAQPVVQPASGDENPSFGASPVLQPASAVSSPIVRNVQSTSSQAGIVPDTVATRASPVFLSPITRSKAVAASNVSKAIGVGPSRVTHSAAKAIKFGRKGSDAPEIAESDSGRMFAKDLSSESDDDDDSDYDDDHDADQYIMLSIDKAGSLNEPPEAVDPRAQSADTDSVVASDGKTNQDSELYKLSEMASLDLKSSLVESEIEKNNDSEMHVENAAQQSEEQLNSAKSPVEDLRNECLIANPSKVADSVQVAEPFTKRKLRSSLKCDIASSASGLMKSGVHGEDANDSPPNKQRKVLVKRKVTVMKNQGVRSSPRFSAKQPVQDIVSKAGFSGNSDDLESSILVSDKFLPDGPEAAREPLKVVSLEEGDRINPSNEILQAPATSSHVENSLPATVLMSGLNTSQVVEKDSIVLNGEAGGNKDYIAGSVSSTVQVDEAVLNAGVIPNGRNGSSAVLVGNEDSTVAEKPNESNASLSVSVDKVDHISVANASTANVTSVGASDEMAEDNSKLSEAMVLDDIASNKVSTTGAVLRDKTHLSALPPIEEHQGGEEFHSALSTSLPKKNRGRKRKNH